MLYSQEEILKAIDAFVQVHGRFPQLKEFTKANQLPSYESIHKSVGKLNDIYKKYYPQLYARKQAEYSKYVADLYRLRRGTTDDAFREELIGKLDRFVQKHYRIPKFGEFTIANGLASKNTMKKYLGDIRTFCMKRYPQYYSQKWDAERVRRAVDLFIIRHKRFPISSDMKKENGLPCIGIFNKFYGNFAPTLKEWYPEYVLKSWTKEGIYTKIDKFVQSNNRLPYASEYNKEHDLPSYGTMKKYCGSTEAIRKERYSWLPPNNAEWDKEKIINALDQFVEKYNRPPYLYEWNGTHSLPNYHQINGWIDAIYELYDTRYPESPFIVRKGVRGYWNSKRIVAAINRFVDINKRLPKIDELRQKNGLPSYKSIAKRFGGWRKLVEQKYPQYHRVYNKKSCFESMEIESNFENAEDATMEEEEQRMTMW